MPLSFRHSLPRGAPKFILRPHNRQWENPLIGLQTHLPGSYLSPVLAAIPTQPQPLVSRKEGFPWSSSWGMRGWCPEHLRPQVLPSRLLP